MKQRVALFVGVMALGLVAAGTANAQGYYYPRDYRPHYEQQLGPWQVMQIVRAGGFVPVSAPVRRGPTYVVTAAGRGGGYMRVFVSAYNGEIVGVRPVMAFRPYGGAPYDPRVGAAPPEQDAPPPPYGPQGARPDGYGPGVVGGYAPGASADRGTVPPRSIPNPPAQRFESAPQTGSIAAPAQPPRSVPSQRIANVPTGSVTAAPTQPERTPIPRPRPSFASADPAAANATAPPAAAARSAAGSAEEVPEAPPAPIRVRPAAPATPPATPMVPVAPLD